MISLVSAMMTSTAFFIKISLSAWEDVTGHWEIKQ